MGIDPVTHGPLQEQKPTREKPIAEEECMNNNNGGASSIDNSSSSGIENSSAVESQPLDPKSYDDPLMSYLLSDNFLEDCSLNFLGNGDQSGFSDFGLSSSSEESSTWLLDSKDLVEDFGLGCFNIDMDILPN